MTPSLIPLAISLALGYAASIAIFKKTPLSFCFRLCVALTVGLGISSIMTFFSFLLCDGFKPNCILSLNILLLILCVALNYSRFSPIIKNLKKPFRMTRSHVIYCFLFFVLGVIAIVCAQTHPYGQWDAWALWNMKAKFLTLSGTSWENLFKLHGHTQPDYPLLLPFMNIWLWVLNPSDMTTAPRLTAILMTLAGGGLLYSSLARYARRDIALVACAFLFSLPSYLIMGTSQYADIIVANYLLLSFFSFVASFREENNGFAFLGGVCLGLLAFTKNEGVVLAALFLAVTLVYSFIETSKGKDRRFTLWTRILLGFLLVSPAILAFKILLAPANPDVGLQHMTLTSRFFNYEGCYMIFSALFQELTHERWQHLWLLIILAAALGGRKYNFKEIKILTWFFFSYAVVLFLIYLSTVNFGLMWRLSRTLPRILFYLLPSLLFSVFYVFEREEKNIQL